MSGAKKTAVWMVRPECVSLGRVLASGLGGDLLPKKFSPATSNREQFVRVFGNYRRWVLIMASGIAVRYLQGLPRSKKSDPAVVVMDDSARFAISLLSGHEGGANELAYEAAALTGAVPVVTTASESLKPLVLGVGCRAGAKVETVHAAILHGLKKVGRRPEEVRELATITRKGREPGIRAWCRRNGVFLRVLPEELVRRRPWVTRPSALVKKTLDLAGVCEPCALLASHGGQLILNKTALNGVTVAIAEEDFPWRTKR